MAWDKVQRPLDLGGLGILNLQVMGWALQTYWLWFQKTDTSRPWNEFDILVHQYVVSVFQIAAETRVGNGSNTLF